MTLIFRIAGLMASLAFFFDSGLCTAAQILRVGRDQLNIAISNDSAGPWAVDETVCVYSRPQSATQSEGQELACGRVVRSTQKGAIVRLDAPSTVIAAGNFVGKAAGVQSRRPTAALMNSVESTEGAGLYNFNLTAGMTISLSAFYPILHFQMAFHPKFALGLMPVYVRASSTVGEAAQTITAFGGLLSANFYNESNFRGLWIQGAGGILRFDASTAAAPRDTANSLVFLATLGWRGYWDLGLNIGVGVGAMYLQSPAFPSKQTEIRSVGILPSVVLDVGMNF